MSTNQSSRVQRVVPEEHLTALNLLTSVGVLLVLAALIFGNEGLGFFDGVMTAMIGVYGLIFLLASVAIRLFPLVIQAVR